MPGAYSPQMQMVEAKEATLWRKPEVSGCVYKPKAGITVSHADMFGHGEAGTRCIT